MKKKYIAQGTYPAAMDVYKCPWCHFYHVGHAHRRGPGRTVTADGRERRK